MSGGNKKKQVRQGFHRELYKHIGLLKREFDKVETAAIFTYRMENVSEEIRELQNLKDAKIRLLRIRFHFEADLVVKEFKDRVQEVLDSDGSDSCGVGHANNSGRHDGKDGRFDKEKGSANKKHGKSRAKRTGRQDAGKRARNLGECRYANIDAEHADSVEQSKRFLKSMKDGRSTHSSQSEGLTESESGENESDEVKPKEQKRKVGKLLFTSSKDGVVVQKLEAEEDCGIAKAPAQAKGAKPTQGVSTESVHDSRAESVRDGRAESAQHKGVKYAQSGSAEAVKAKNAGTPQAKGTETPQAERAGPSQAKRAGPVQDTSSESAQKQGSICAQDINAESAKDKGTPSNVAREARREEQRKDVPEEPIRPVRRSARKRVQTTKAIDSTQGTRR